LIAFLMLFALTTSGCGGCNSNERVPDAPDTGKADAASDAEADAADEVVCTPGELLGCREENTPAINVCNPQGTGPVAGSCEGVQVCREGACVPVSCIPGQRRCLGSGAEATPQVCADDGSAFEDGEACDPGFLCEEGVCLNRCEIAERTGSYIGCEYWAVELENHLLYTDNTGVELLPPEQMPPFAVVLANTSETYDAEITVFSADGEIAEADGTRLARDKSPQPGVDFVTVHSEVVGPDGQRVGDILDGPIDGLTLPRGSIMTLILPHRRMPYSQTSVTPAAFKVTSTQPVVAYQFNPLCCNYNTTNDASLLLPKGALTENYMHLGYAVFAGNAESRLPEPWSATVTVLATEPDTDVTVQLPPPKGAGRPPADIIYPPGGNRVTGPDANGVMTVRLQPHEAFNVAGTGKAPVEDLTGARITASKPVAVFGGHACAYVPFNKGFCDHLESQLFPLETWGQRFVAAELKLRQDPPEPGSREATYWKFVARKDGTVIDTGINLASGLDGVFPPADEGVPTCASFSEDPSSGRFTLDAGQTCEFGIRKMFLIQSSEPIQVGAFISGQATVKQDVSFGDFAGDPGFFLLPPEEQYRTSYSILTPATYFFSYVTVTMQPGFALTLDGQALDLTEYDYAVEPISGLIRAHVPVDPGPHRLSAQVPFGLVVYGYDDFVSYAYTGGLNLNKLSVIE
jgi:hypothetical protein